MKEFQFRHAKANLSQVVDDVVEGERAVITRHGKKVAVVLSWDDYERLNKVPSFGWLLANSPLEEGDLKERRPARAFKAPAL